MTVRASGFFTVQLILYVSNLDLPCSFNFFLRLLANALFTFPLGFEWSSVRLNNKSTFQEIVKNSLHAVIEHFVSFCRNLQRFDLL